MEGWEQRGKSARRARANLASRSILFPLHSSYMGKGVTKAVDNVNKLIAPALLVSGRKEEK